jgi:hypothetical protein
MKQLSLENFGVHELDAREMKESGGLIGIGGLILVGLAIAAGTQIMSDWDNFKAGLGGLPQSCES